MHTFKITIVLLSANFVLAHCDCSANGGICSAGVPNIQQCCCTDVQTDSESGDQTCAPGSVCGESGSTCSSGPSMVPTPNPVPVPSPAPIPMPVPVSVPSPAPIPTPVSVPVPSPASIPTSMPVPVPSPAPVPTPVPTPTPNGGSCIRTFVYVRLVLALIILYVF